jgi:putative acetyltransferase
VIAIRPEQSADADAVRVVNQRAFGRPDEAAIVDAVRESPGAISLVAIDGDRVVGHILFTPVVIDGSGSAIRAAGLAPMAVVPEHQRLGVGSRLVTAGLEACRDFGYEIVVVLGHPAYYPRFGFIVAASQGLRCEYDVPAEVFMAIELRAGALRRAQGLVRYRAEFGVKES